MGEHSADQRDLMSRVRELGYWALAHRRKIVSVAVIAIPIVARVFPEFPADEALSLLRTYFGA